MSYHDMPLNSLLLLHNKDNEIKAQPKKGTRCRISNCKPVNQLNYVLAYSTALKTRGQEL